MMASLRSESEKGIPDMRDNMFICEVCDVELTSEVDLKNHMGGKKHQAKLRQGQGSNLLGCELCNVKFAGDVDLKAHMAGKKHKAKLSAAKG